MSYIVTGSNLPKDIISVLKRYGMPDECISFELRCDGPDQPLLVSFKSHAVVADGAELDVETRTFKLLVGE